MFNKNNSELCYKGCGHRLVDHWCHYDDINESTESYDCSECDCRIHHSEMPGRGYSREGGQWQRSGNNSRGGLARLFFG